MKPKIIYRTELLSTQEKKRVRSFVKNHDCSTLTIIFTDEWGTVNFRKKGVLYQNRLKGCYLGLYESRRYSDKKTIWVRMKNRLGEKDPRWYYVFLHEMGHFVDESTNGRFKKYQRREKFAEDFAELHATDKDKEDLNTENENVLQRRREKLLRRAMLQGA